MDFVDNVELLNFVMSTNPLSDVVDEVVNEIFLWILLASTVVIRIAIPGGKGGRSVRIIARRLQWTLRSILIGSDHGV